MQHLNRTHRQQTATNDPKKIVFGGIIGFAGGSLVGGILSGIAATVIGILLATAVITAGTAVIGLFCCMGGGAMLAILAGIACAALASKVLSN